MQTTPVTKEAVDAGESLYRRWYRTHGVGVNHALLAATVMLEGGKLVTQNVRHFPMPEIEVERGWE